MFPENEELSEDVQSKSVPDPDQMKSGSQLSRRDRRIQEKNLKAHEAIVKKQRMKSIESLWNNVQNLVKAYTDGYNTYSKENPDNQRGLRSVAMPTNMSMTSVNIQELMGTGSPEDLARLTPCIIPTPPGEPAGMTLVRVMYFRVETIYTFAPGVEISARPGVPEAVNENSLGEKVQQQLFYHAVFPLPSEDGPEMDVAKEKLLADFITHVFCMGLDMQQINNNNQWQAKLNNQTHNLKDKINEVEEIFSHIGAQNDNMKVNSQS